MYILLGGKPPYPGKTDKEVQHKILEGNPPSFTGKEW
jgi:hypothetical protein